MKKGFSLLELLVVTAVFFLIGAGLARTLGVGQQTYSAEKRRLSETQQARVALNVIVRYLRQAGNDPFGHLRANNLNAIEYDPDQARLRIRSDITGSQPSSTSIAAESTGDPDGALDSVHENVLIQLQGSTLEMDIGYGTEVLADEISVFSISLYDSLGSPTTDSEEAARATVTLTTEENLALRTDVFLLRTQS